MKRKLLVAAVFTAFGHAPASFATNWYEVYQTEPVGAPAYTIWGFIQPQFVHNTGGAVSGLTGPAAPLNGKVPVFNMVGPDLTSKDQGQFFRARPGVRGALANDMIDYFLLAEVGNNAITKNGFYNGAYNERSFVMSDATVTLNYIPGARIRLGLGRLPLGEEAMLGEPALDYTTFTNVTDGLLNERFLAPVAGKLPTTAGGVKFNPTSAGGAAGNAALVGSVGAFRDTGVQVFDWFRQGKMEYAYALMVSQADGVNFDTSNNPGNHDVTGRMQASYVFGGSGPRRQDLTAFIWHQEGKRYFSGVNYDRMREGLGLKYWDGKFRVGGEYIQGSGMIYMGPNPPFGAPVASTQLMAMESSNKANGYYLDTGWKFAEKFEADLRYDTYDKMTNSAFDERKLDTWTVGGQYFYSKAMRFILNYSYRTAKVANPVGTSAAQQTALNNAMNILDATGNVFSVQMTYMF